MFKKIKLLFFLLGISILVLSSCSKDDDDNTSPDGTTNFELRFTCTSSNPYLVEVNGKSNQVDGNSYISYQFPMGTYSWKVTQLSGYVLYPTVQQGTVTLDQDKEIVFP